MRPWLSHWRARLAGTGVGARLARGTLWAMASAVLVRGLGLIGSMLAGRILGAEAFGQIGVVQQVVAMMGTLAGLGVGTTAARFIAASRSTDPARAGRIMTATAMWSWGSALVGAVALACLAPWFARGPLAAPALAGPLLAAIPLLVFSLVAQALAGGLAGFEAFRPAATASVIAGLVSVPIQVLGAWWFGVSGVVVGLAVAEFLRWVLGQRPLARAMRAAAISWQRPGRHDVRELLAFGVPSMAAGMLVGPVMLACFAVVGRTPAGYAEVGLFQATQQYRNVLIFVAVQAAGAVVPVLSAAYHAGDTAGVARGLRRAFSWALVPSTVLSALLAIASPWAMRGFGATFADHGSLLLWLALMTPVQALNAVGIAVVSALGKPWMTLVATAVFACAVVVIVAAWPSATALVISQGLGSLLAFAVIAWSVREHWNPA